MPRPSELPTKASDIAKARVWLQSRGHKNVLLGSKNRAQKDVLEEILYLHNRMLDDIIKVDCI